MQPRTTRLHPILYTSFIWLIGGLLAVVYGLTHEVDGLQLYKIVYEQPRPHVTTAADAFSVLDEGK
jgi:hypothetical protein